MFAVVVKLSDGSQSSSIHHTHKETDYRAIEGICFHRDS